MLIYKYQHNVFNFAYWLTISKVVTPWPFKKKIWKVLTMEI